MTYQLIAKPVELEKLVRRLENAPVIAYDTEFISEGRYTPQLCLVQLAAGEILALIDPLAPLSLEPLWELFCDGKREMIVHACRSEMEFCHRALGRLPDNLFDVQLAAGFIGIDYPCGFRPLIDKLLKIDLPKVESRTVWNKRPLTSRQIEYALGDVRYLEKIAGLLKDRLTSSGRLNWYREEIADHLERMQIDFATPKWRNVPKSAGLSPRELAIVREVWFWRDRLAKKWNLPGNRVLRDDLIVELARRKTSDPSRISSVRGFQRNDLAKILPEISVAVKKALELPEKELPPVSDRFSYPKYHVMSQFLHAAMGAICKQQHISQQLVGGPGDVRELIADLLGTLPKEIKPKLRDGWRSELIGSQIHDLLDGRTTIRLNPATPENPLVFTSK